MCISVGSPPKFSLNDFYFHFISSGDAAAERSVHFADQQMNTEFETGLKIHSELQSKMEEVKDL